MNLAERPASTAESDGYVWRRSGRRHEFLILSSHFRSTLDGTGNFLYCVDACYTLADSFEVEFRALHVAHIAAPINEGQTKWMNNVGKLLTLAGFMLLEMAWSERRFQKISSVIGSPRN